MNIALKDSGSRQNKAKSDANGGFAWSRAKSLCPRLISVKFARLRLSPMIR
jgi:hypothetical protein